MHSESRAASEPGGIPPLEELDALLDDLAQQARSALPRSAFCANLLAGMIATSQGAGGVVWLRETGGRWVIGAIRDVASGAPGPETQQAAESGEIQFASDGSSATEEVGLIVAAPWVLDGETEGVLELHLRRQDNAGLRRGLSQILTALAEIAEEYFVRAELRRLRRSEETSGQIERFVEETHRHVTWKATAFALANEARVLVDCGRVTVFRRSGRRKYRAESISGASAVERRSREVRLLESLAGRCGLFEESLWFGFRNTSPEAETVFAEYVDSHPSKSLVSIPLLRTRRAADVLLLLEFYEVPADEVWVRDRVQRVLKHGEAAASAALAIERMPLRTAGQALQALGLHSRSMTLAASFGAFLILTILTILAFTVPTDLEVPARGQLQPVVQNRIFAPADGVIADLTVAHGAEVREGDVLVQMRDSQLDFDETRITGELQTLQAELATVRTTRIRGAPATADEDETTLAAREAALQQELANRREQLAILGRKREELSVRSPIAGQVVSGDLRQDLSLRRPVKRGQQLMVVATTDGPWRLELEVADQRMRPVLEQSRDQSAPLKVRFMLASEPGVMYEGRVERIGMSAEAGADGQPAVEIIAAFDRTQVPQLHVGADVAARIVCGRRSLAYAWLHGVYEKIRLQFFL